LFAARAGRVLIGDEMGLGKTIQALATAEIMAKYFGVERVLIVCPTSLKHQWEREIERFTKRSAIVIGGPQTKRRELFAEESFFKIINYDTIHRDLQSIEDWSPELVILDEAQRIKNWETRTAKSVKQIHSPYCVVLTGTPLENRLQELVSIVQFIDQHRLGPTYQFLDRHQQHEADTGRVVGYRDLDLVAKTLEPILIRRRKAEVLDQLPGRLEKHIFTQMTPQQTGYHDENRETVARVVQKWRRCGFLSQFDQTRLMISLQNMRMSCNSTFLLDKETDFSTKPDELDTLLGEVLEEPQVKVVVFSQWVRMHELIQRRIDARRWEHVLFCGSVPSTKRKALVDRFREDSQCRLFLATDAGGVGLNLQHASVVVNMDIPWNPAILEQRIGRVHRLGQTRPVQVVNFVAEGTIEHSMLSLLGFKKSLFAGVLDGGEKNVFMGNSRLGKFMETVEKATDSIPESPQPTSTAADTLTESLESRVDSAEPTNDLAATASDPFSNLLEQGLGLLQQLALASQTTQSKNGSSHDFPSLEIARDQQTGKSYLKVPVPKPELVNQALELMTKLVQSWR